MAYFLCVKLRLKSATFAMLILTIIINIVILSLNLMTKENLKMEIGLKKWGNSQGIILPKNILQKAGIEDNKAKFNVEVNEDKEIVLKEDRLTLDKLFEGFDYKKYWSNWEKEHPDQLKEEDWGESIGKEIF